jgi:putative transposase
MMAIWRWGKPDALLHHSDQGSQYTSEPFQCQSASKWVLIDIIGIAGSHDPMARVSLCSTRCTIWC